MKNRGFAIIVLFFAASVLLLWLSPSEQTLGQWVKLIYFHVILALVGLFAFYLSGLLGAAFLIFGREPMALWSRQLGISALVLWVFSVALSLASMQLVWGGLIWNEPLTLVALTVLFVGVGKEIISIGSSLKFRAVANAAFAVAIIFLRSNLKNMAGSVMHPDNPIMASESVAIKVYPLLLLFVAAAALIEFTRWRLTVNKN